MPICIECSYPVPQLYHVLHSRNHKKPPPLPPKPKPISAPSVPAKKAASKSTSSLRGLHESFKSSLRSSDPRTSESAETTDNAPSKSKASVAGTDVRLTQCPRCKRFADKYVEHDFVVLFIDLVLVKPQVYRHLLFNRLHASSTSMDPSIIRLAILLLLFDVYITWSHIESLPPHLTSDSKITKSPLLIQYLFFLLLSFFTTLSQHLTIRYLASWTGLTSASPRTENNPPPNYNTITTTTTTTEGTSPNPTPVPTPNPTTQPTPNAISTALTVSSSMSLFPLLMVVWNYATPTPSPTGRVQVGRDLGGDLSTFTTPFVLPATPTGDIDWVRTGVAGIVFVQNWEALRILLGCGYFSAAGLVAAGGLVRGGVRGMGLRLGGLG